MATTTDLILDFSICSGSACKSLIFKELTSTHTLRPSGGWDTTDLVNDLPTIANASTAVLSIISPSGVTYSFDLYDDFPTTDTTQEYTILNTQLGLNSSNKLLSGIYTVTYTLTGTELDGDDLSLTDPPGSWVATKTIQFLVSCKEVCNLDKLASRITIDNCCDNQLMEDYIQAQAYLDLASNNAECQKLNLSVLFLQKVNNLLNSNNCNTC